ncbi:MAG: CHAT domain-containing protein [Cytophagaceae bacterium]|jgi:tetratricopeptide (TPR) repeat protein|nr:CHAT domain-containing protein [Cytophagaceae bacterium]
MKRFYLILLFIAHATAIYSKGFELEPFFADLELDFQHGDYRAGKKKLVQNRGNISAIGGTDGLPNARAYCYEARFVVALDLFGDFQVNMDAAQRIFSKFKNTYSEDLAFAYLAACEAYIAYDEMWKAEGILNSLLQFKKEQKITSDIVSARIEYLSLKLLLKQGFILQALRKSEPVFMAYQRIIFNSKKASKEELACWKSQYAELVLMNGIAHYKNGDFTMAQTVFQTTIDWIKKNDAPSGSDAMAYYYKGLIKLEENNLTEANDALQQAETIAKSSFKPGAENYILIQEQLIPVLKKLEKNKEAQIQNNAMDASINDYYGRRGYHFQRNRLNDIARDLIIGNYDRARKDLTEIAYQNPEIPKNHLFRSTLCEMLYYLYLKQNQYQLALQNLQESIRIRKEKLGENAPYFHAAQLKLAEFYYTYQDNLKESEDIFSKSLDAVLRKEIGPKSSLMRDFLFMEISLFEITDRYEKAYQLIRKYATETEKYAGNTSLLYAIATSRFAQTDLKAGSYGEAEKKIKQAEAIFDKTKGDLHYRYYSEMMRVKSELLLVSGQFEEAEKALRKSISLSKKITGDYNFILSDGLEQKALLDIYYGRLSATESLLNSLIKEREKKFGPNSRSLITPLRLLSQIFLNLGEYVQAERIQERALTISKIIFTDKSINYAENLQWLNQLHLALGDYEKAEKNAHLCYQLFKTSLGSKHVKTALAESQLAYMMLLNGKKYSDCQQLFSEALVTVQAELGSDNPLVAEIYENYASLLARNNEYKEAEVMVGKALQIWQTKLGESNVHAGSLYRVKGNIAFAQKKFASSAEFYLTSKTIFSNLFDAQHPEYIVSLGLYARAIYAAGDIKKAIAASEENTDKSLLYIRQVFPALTERSKALFWDKAKEDFEFYKSITFTNPSLVPTMVEKTFAILLQTKAILLNSSIKTRQRILSSKDTTLISLFTSWQKKKEEYTSALAQSGNLRKESGIDLNTLENEIEGLEKKLSQYALFKNERSNIVYDWKLIKNNLLDSEQALEFTQFRIFKDGFTDSTWYAVLSVSKDTKTQPDAVILKNGKHLNGKFLNYYRNCMRAEITDEFSYVNYWAPLIPLIRKSAQTIYVSLDGVFNTINLETIQLPEGNYVINQYNLHILSSTRDLLQKRNYTGRNNAAKQPFALFGNPSYYDTGSETPRKIADLPGAEAEVNDISKLLSTNKQSVLTFTGAAASEEKIKSLQNPYALHIATHGYFSSGKNQAGEALDPLIRSGLLLKNGGELTALYKGYELNKSEGVLTAREVLNLNFDSTSLVVLSACETGLGEISTGEGVFGLQRAFLVAGAGNVIMSLFKINDEATKDLMEVFYEQWVKTGDKRKSFIEAKKAIQQKYKSPRIWGAFLMIGV